MEEILIPMECLYDIPSVNQMSMPSYKKGDIFMFNPHHEIHVELDEHGVFKEIDNDLCDFTCKYPDLLLNGTYYQINEKIADKDIKSLDDETLKSLYYIGYLDKRLKVEEENNKPTKTNKPKNKTTQKPTAETYTAIASKLGMKSATFKKACFNELGINIKDMRKRCPKTQANKIKKCLSKK